MPIEPDRRAHFLTKLLLKSADTIVTCDSEKRVYHNADLLITDNVISQIGDNISVAGEDVNVIDCKGKAIFPGLINTHHHFFQTFVRNRMSINYPSMTVIEWLDRIYKIFVHFDEEMLYYSSLTALSDLVKHGCTTAFDHQYCHTKPNGRQMVDQSVKAAAEIGARYVGGRGGNTLPLEEGSTIPHGMLETTDEFLQDCERLIANYHDASRYAMTQIIVAPCQPVNCYPETFRDSALLARKHGVRMHTHLGEGENPAIEAKYGMRTLDWCEEYEFIGDDVSFAHCWELTPEEFEKIGRYGAGVSHCPAPAVLGGFPIIDMKQILSTGTVLSLGCDGSATNDSSNLLDTIRLAYLLQAWHSKKRDGAVTPYQVLEMATAGGAKTLGRPELGSLAVNQAADLFALDINRLEYVGGLHDMKNFIPRLGLTGQVDFTIINGRFVFRDGELQLVNEIDIKQAADKCQQRINALIDAHVN